MLLDLPGYNPYKKEIVGDEMTIYVETDFIPTTCPKCSNLFGSFYGHGSRPQVFHDVPMLGKRMALKIDRKRYKCRDCGGTFEEPLEAMHPSHNMTNRLAAFVVKECYRDKFTDVARRAGLIEKTVREIFRAHVQTLITAYKFDTPECLGIDEIHIRSLRCVITNLKEGSVIDMLPSRNPEDLMPFLLGLNRQNVKIVTMDMHLPYRAACRIAFPGATLVVDRFHVQKLGNHVMTRARVDAIKAAKDLPKAQTKGLKKDKYIFLSRHFNLTEYQEEHLLEWVRIFPELGNVYEKKERFMDIWAIPDRAGAEAAYDAWIKSMTPELKPHFKAIIRDFKILRNEIFNWWDHKYTNALTEALNGQIRELHRAGRGYSFDVLRAKIICKTGAHRVKAIPPKFNKNAFSKLIDTTSYVNYGVDLSTAIKLLEQESESPVSTLLSE